jgi:hypothetical protein
MDADTLLQEITMVFPQTEMPSLSELISHGHDCPVCNDLQEDLEQYMGKEITANVIRMIYLDMSHLSAKGWRWILPHYLKFSLTPEAEYSRMETEFLIYKLRPAPEFEEATEQRLSALDDVQFACLIHFLEWCLNQPFWRAYCPNDIKSAISFLSTSRSCSRSSSD